MSLPGALLKVLNDTEEPLNKRLRIADNAFNSSEFQLHHKEALLFKWILKSSSKISDVELWLLARNWLASTEFRDLTPNDISNDDILTIVELFIGKLCGNKISTIEKQQIIELVLLLCDNKIFQHYFKYNIELYSKLVAHSLESIELVSTYTEFIKKPFWFPKNILHQDNFAKYFLELLYPVLIKKALEFVNSTQVFDETVHIIQKCILQGNTKAFQSFLTQLFEPEIEEKEDIVLPKSIFIYLSSTIQEDTSIASLSFKVFFSAFTENLKDPQWSFKLLIFFVELLQFNVSKDFNNFKISFKQKSTAKLSKSLNILLGILDVISTRNLTDGTVSKISLTEFLRNILKLLISLNLRSSLVFEFILKCIAINPLVIEPLVSGLIVFVMLGNHDDFKEVYEQVVIGIFEVFSKLHRVENFIAKMIPALKNALTMEAMETDEDSTLYSFKGDQDIHNLPVKLLSVSDIFTDNIMKCFTRCLNGLASWQVINVFKTMLYHLKATAEEYASDSLISGTGGFIFLEILGTLTTCLLQSVKVADQSIPQNVVVKFVKGLEELESILKNFGPAILKREHNHITMRTFLNLSYTWAEIYITLTYYSMNKEVQIRTVTDNTYSSANLQYLHSYLAIKEWQLIAQRITNFGEYPCKKLLQKLYIQKLRAMLLLEKNISEDIVTNIIKTLQSHLDDTWQDLILDKFSVNFVLPKMDAVSLTFLAEHLIEDGSLYGRNHVRDSVTLTNATTYVVMSKINKLFKMKRKHDTEQSKSISSRVFAVFPEQMFFTNEESDVSKIIENVMEISESTEHSGTTSAGIGSKEETFLSYLGVLKKLPFIYSNVNIQKLTLLYLFSLSTDILNCSDTMRKELEDIIIGSLQMCKYPLTDIFKIELLGPQVLSNFSKSDVIFSLIVDNVFKHESSIPNFEPLVLHLTKNLNSKCLSSSIVIIQAVNKIKKSKIDGAAKDKANQYKEKILAKISKLVCKSDFLVEAYATCLKHYLSLQEQNELEDDTLKKLLDKLGAYIAYALRNISNENKRGCAILFTAVLQNKTKIDSVANDIVLKIWNACKKISVGDEYSHLVKLIVTLIPNDEFEKLVTDLFSFTDKNVKDQSYSQLSKQLKTWESILTCDVNPTKMKIWQEVLENLIYELLHILKNTEYDETLYRSIVHLEQSIIQSQHFILSPPLTDMFIMTTSILMQHQDQHFESVFPLAISTLEMLLKHRNALVMDRLPAFLQQYRVLLKAITVKSDATGADSGGGGVQTLDVKRASDCVHTLEKLTKNLVTCKKDMSRIAVFLIADILERYEQINLYPNVKLHLNNCVYSLISICDHHAVAYLMRVLSSASTEMFKIMYEHYKKYYMFTGKV